MNLEELEKGKYYNIQRRSDDFEYNHLKLIEIYNTCVDSILHFVNNEGINVLLDYCDILDICESRPKVKELELKKGRYYDVITNNNDYKHLILIEFNYTGIDSILHFVNNEGINVLLDYCDILDICESKEKESKKKESKEYQCEIYFKNNRLYPEFKYDIYESLDGVIDLVHRNTKLDGVGYSKNGPYLRVLINNGETAYIKIKNIKKIEHVE